MRSTAFFKQYSLRTLLIAPLAMAVLLVVWRTAEPMVVIAGTCLVGGMVLAFRLRDTWPRALLLTLLATHGPFLAATIYTLIYVPCAHCKSAMALLFPFGAGVIIYEFTRQWFDWPQLPQFVTFTSAAVTTLAVVAAVCLVARKTSKLVQITTLTLVIAASGYGAAALYAAVRS